MKLILGHLQDIEKVAWLQKKYTTAIPSFFDTAKNKKVNKQSSQFRGLTQISTLWLWHEISEKKITSY